MNIFEKATRLGLRFESKRGLISVEDLWKLPLTSRNDDSLDNIGISIIKKLKEQSTESLVSISSPTNTVDELRLEIIKHIISIKQTEITEKERKEATRTEVNKIDAIIEAKKQKVLEDTSIEDLEKMKAQALYQS